MLRLLLLILVLVKSSAESALKELDAFFENKRNEVIEKGANIRDLIFPKDDKKQYIQYKPKKYTMNMKDSIEDRWSPLCDEYTTNYTVIYNYLNDVLESTKTASIVYFMAMKFFDTYVTDPYKSEIEYFASCTGVPLKGVIVINLMEIFLLMGGTSIVCSNSENDLIFGNNLDIWLLDIQDELRSVMINVQYTSGKDLLFAGDSFFGYSGVIAGVTPNGYAVAVNCRYTDGSIIDSLFALAYNGSLPYSWLVRNTLSNYDKYSDAVQEFEVTPIATPAYFIVAGTKYPNGVVINRNLTDSINPFELETSYLDWYILQTNDDWWEEPIDNRRNDGIKNMELMGQDKASEKRLLFDVLSTINFGTVAQTLMMAGGKDSSSLSDLSSSEDGKKMMHKIWIVQFEEPKNEDKSYVGMSSAQVDMINFKEGEFINTFERLWQRYVAIGISIFVASIFFNFLMCIYWSGGYKNYKENIRDEVTKVIMSESELTETESSDRDDDDF